MQLPPPAVFHDKDKRTLQGNLLGRYAKKNDIQAY